MIIEKYFLSLTNLCCHSVKKFVKKIFYLNIKVTILKNLLYYKGTCSLLHSWGMVWVSNLRGLCLHSGGSRPPSLIWIMYFIFNQNQVIYSFEILMRRTTGLQVITAMDEKFLNWSPPNIFLKCCLTHFMKEMHLAIWFEFRLLLV